MHPDAGEPDGGIEAGTTTGFTTGASDAAPPPRRDAGPLTGCAAQVPTAIFATTCEGKACHNSTDKEYGLDLQSPSVGARQWNRSSLELPSAKIIDPINPDSSFILLKVSRMSPPVGLQMPELAAKLSPAQITCLQQWVEWTAATGGI
jgi:hypothetical protein